MMDKKMISNCIVKFYGEVDNYSKTGKELKLTLDVPHTEDNVNAIQMMIAQDRDGKANSQLNKWIAGESETLYFTSKVDYPINYVYDRNGDKSDFDRRTFTGSTINMNLNKMYIGSIQIVKAGEPFSAKPFSALDADELPFN